MIYIPLTPFSKESVKGIEIEAGIQRDGLTLQSIFKINGDISRVLIPKRNSPKPSRMTGLWETTCLELFIKNKNHNDYLEFNFSPTGNWNSFYFTEYRAGMAEFSGIERIEIIFTKSESCLQVEANLQLKEKRHFLEEDFTDGHIKCGLSAVVENTQNQKSYWAIKHFSKKPDFHLDDNFSLIL